MERTTILIRDENGEGFPVAFLFSNRQTEDVYKYFSTSVKEKIGNINAKIFMSYDYPPFYNAWSAIFRKTEFHLLCKWHVKRA